MKKIIAIIAFSLVALVSCNKFQVENTATVNLAGNWVCTVYGDDGNGNWAILGGAEFLTYNTVANVPTEIWITDQKGFWETFCKIDANNGAFSFGKEGKEYLDNYNGVGQMIWGGKVTNGGAKAPGTKSTVDKIEFFIAFSDDNTPYCSPYYVAGYRRTGFPEDDEEIITDFETPAFPTVPAVTEPLPTPAP